MYLRSKDLEKYKLKATDGEIGHVADILFDDREWKVRYLVVNTGDWLSDRMVLLQPTLAHAIGGEEKLLPVELTMKQIEESPPLYREQPVSGPQQDAIHSYYGWPVYWGGGSSLGAAPPYMPLMTREENAMETARVKAEEASDPHLRSMNEIKGYRIEAQDDEIGHVQEFLIDSLTWDVKFLIVDTKNWLPGRKVLLAPQWTERIDWFDGRVHVRLTRDEVKHSPEYDSDKPLPGDYEQRLRDYYGSRAI